MRRACACVCVHLVERALQLLVLLLDLQAHINEAEAQLSGRARQLQLLPHDVQHLAARHPPIVFS